MDDESERRLAAMIRGQRIASLGTLHEGSPLVSLIAYVPAPDFSAFYIHASRLAQHTRDMLENPRVGLMIAEASAGSGDPQTLARISILGEVAVCAAAAAPPAEVGSQADAAGYAEIRAAYLARFPAAAMTFPLADFALYRIQPQSARYVAGLGKAFNLRPERLRQVAAVRPANDE